MFIPCDMAQMGKGALTALGTCSFALESEKCGWQQRNAMNGLGCTGEADETSKARQFFRLDQSTWKRLYIQFFELLEGDAAYSRVVKHECV